MIRKAYRMNQERTEPNALGIEAGEWLLRLQESEHEHREAFMQWLTRSPRHVAIFLETFEVYRLLGTMDPARLLSVETLLRSLDSDVIHVRRAGAVVSNQPPRGFRRFGAAAAAAVVALACGAWLWSRYSGPPEFTTAVGEQRICKLADGSFVYLNTDSRISIDFSERERKVRLEKGEALFAVERDSSRPFVVSTRDASIRVLGTQFNVHRREHQTDVAVIEGSVQVTPFSPASASKVSVTHPLRSGDEMRIGASGVERKANANLRSVVSWRMRRLAFTEAPLAEVAAEFNRYNEKKIRVQSNVPVSKRLTGIFDADRPSSLVMYAMKDEGLVVEPKDGEWIIKAR